MADAAGRISKLQIFCPCGKSFENTDSYLEHKRLCAIYQEGRKIISMTPSSNLSAATVPARASIPAPTKGDTAPLWTELYDQKDARKAFTVFEDSSGRKE
jgi:hypothetical protein